MPSLRAPRPQNIPKIDLASGWALGAMALLVTLITASTFLHHDHQMPRTLGDTDDAMRLVLVRDLAGGRGWYDQWVTRLQPPVGSFMHWSRLLDGGLAGVLRIAELFMPSAQAELAVRTFWPLAWILPASAASLAIARGLGGARAVLAGAALLILNPWTFVQFQPGRIDHHNVQVTLTLAAAAFSLAGGERFRGAILAGAASALALAIGIESLAFHALIGLGWGLRLLSQPRAARPVRAYGLSLALVTGGLFLAQTPPARWTLSVCDALGWNLTLAITVAGLGLAVVASLEVRRPLQIALLATVGLAAAGAYLAFDPACLHGPFAAVDPRLRPFWFDGIEELKSWPALLRDNRAAALRIFAVSVAALASALVLIWRARRRTDAGVFTIAACTGVAIVATFHAFRMEDYAFSFGLPVVAAAVASVGEWTGLAPALAVLLLISPATMSWGAGEILARIDPAKTSAASPNARCYDTDVYAGLARQPEGLVLADINLGPFILAHTSHSVLAAPYHRMSWGILAAHRALGAAPDQAQAQVRTLGVRYIVECGALTRVGPGSFEWELRRGAIPSWLKPISAPGDMLQIYRVELEDQPSKEP